MSKESVFFARELEKIIEKVYEKEYPELKGISGEFFPITSMAGPGDESITYRMSDRTGVAKIITNYADDLPAVDVSAKEFTTRIKSVADSFHYSRQEMIAAMTEGKQLDQSKANAARKAIEEKMNQLSFFGDASHNVQGLFTHPNIPVTINTGTKITDPAATGQDMYNILKQAFLDMINLTNGVEVPDTVMLPIEEYGLIASTQYNQGTDTTVLQFFLQNFPQITRIGWASELKDVEPRPSGDAGSTDIMVMFKRDEDKVRMEIPVMFEQLEPETRNLASIVNCHARFAGIITPYPLSISMTEEI